MKPSLSDVQLEPNEHVILTSYRHWINLLPPAVSSVVLLVAAAAVAYLSGRYHGKVGSVSIPTTIVVGVLLLLVLFSGLLMGLALWVYRRNLLILTNRHIIKLKQEGLFARRTSKLTLDQVEDVSGSRRGLIPTILDFGNLEIETAGAQEEFLFSQMPDPAGLANSLCQARDEFAAPEGEGIRETPPTTASPLQSQAVATDPEVVVPHGAPPPPIPAPEPPPSQSLDLDPVEDDSSSTTPDPEPPVTEPPTSLADFEPPQPETSSEPPAPISEELPPTPPPPSANELTENQPVQLPPPESPSP